MERTTAMPEEKVATSIIVIRSWWPIIVGSFVIGMSYAAILLGIKTTLGKHDELKNEHDRQKEISDERHAESQRLDQEHELAIKKLDLALTEQHGQNLIILQHTEKTRSEIKSYVFDENHIHKFLTPEDREMCHKQIFGPINEIKADIKGLREEIKPLVVAVGVLTATKPDTH